MPQTWEVTNRTCSNLSNLYSIFAGFRMFQMSKLQFLQSWRFQNIQQNILWRPGFSGWSLTIRWFASSITDCNVLGPGWSHHDSHSIGEWMQIVSKCIKVYQIVQRRLLELFRNNLQELVLRRIVVAYSILKRQRCTKGDPQKTLHKLWHVLARARPDSPMSQSSPWRGERWWKQERASVSRPYKTSVKPVLLHAFLIFFALYAMC